MSSVSSAELTLDRVLASLHGSCLTRANGPGRGHMHRLGCRRLIREDHALRAATPARRSHPARDMSHDEIVGDFEAIAA